LPQQGQRIVAHTIVLTRIAKPHSPVTGQIMTLIKSPQRQKSGIAGNLAAGKIGVDGLLTVEGERELWYNTLYQAMDAPKGNAGAADPGVHNSFRASLLFGLETS